VDNVENSSCRIRINLNSFKQKYAHSAMVNKSVQEEQKTSLIFDEYNSSASSILFKQFKNQSMRLFFIS
jgi:hypothetical protein